MEKKIIENKKINEKYIYVKHDSGLDILICEMEGFSTAEAIFGTKYGSINVRFKTDKDKEYISVPEGIAHFLEHKLFENKDCDTFDLYAKTGAYANAFTSFEKTCYLFSCSDKYKESLEILLTSVQSPYFTEETVQKEQGIIAQEIKMYEDNPSWRVFFNLLGILYHNHPIKIDIAGTVESISKINADLLYKCYNTFYNLNNMVLAVAGNVKADEVLEIADKFLKPSENTGLETVFEDEPDDIVKKEIVQHLSVGVPLFNIGFKAHAEKGFANVKAEMETTMVMNILSDSSSPLYKRMIEEEMINSSFSSEVFNGDGFFSMIFGGESEKPYDVMEEIIKEIENAKVNGLDKRRFEMLKKASYGDIVRQFNNVDEVADALINSYFSGTEMYDELEIISQMTYEDVQKCLCERFDTSKVAISIVEN